MKSYITLFSSMLFAINHLFAQGLEQEPATPNGGFENWTEVPAATPAPAYDQPNGWNTLNSLTAGLGKITCKKSTDRYDGESAIQLITKTIGATIANGLVTTGVINQATSSVGGGIAYTLRPDSIIGWYKSAPETGDSGFIELQLLGSGGDTDTVGYAIFRTPGTVVSTYTRFAVEIDYRSSSAVAKALWILSSSRDNTTHFENSQLWVDNLQLGSGEFDFSGATSIENIEVDKITVGPNPTNKEFNVNNPEQENLTVTIYNSIGTIIKSVSGNDAILNITTTNLSNGVYFYSITDKNQETLKANKLIIQK